MPTRATSPDTQDRPFRPLIVTAKLNNVDPQAWLANVRARIAELPHTQVHQLLPWNWKTVAHQTLPARDGAKVQRCVETLAAIRDAQ